MLQLVFPAFGAKLRNADTRCIINNQIGFTNGSRAFNQVFPFLIGKLTGSDMLGIYFGLQGKQTVHQLLLGHLKTEHCYRLVLLKGDMLCNIQNKRRLTHGRTGRNQNQIGGLQSCSPVVQINESCGNTGHSTFIFRCLLDFVHGIHNHLADGYEISGVSLLYHGKDLFLRLFQNHFQTLLAQITGILDLFRQFD